MIVIIAPTNRYVFAVWTCRTQYRHCHAFADSRPALRGFFPQRTGIVWGEAHLRNKTRVDV